jgi:Cu(I)/Ag(I) efflux system membrane protein CusA/SilA
MPTTTRLGSDRGGRQMPTDPAPLSMVETVVQLKPKSEWRTRFQPRFYHGWAPAWSRPAFNALWPEYRPMTHDELVDEMHQRLSLVGWTNASPSRSATASTC